MIRSMSMVLNIEGKAFQTLYTGHVRSAMNETDADFKLFDDRVELRARFDPEETRGRRRIVFRHWKCV